MVASIFRRSSIFSKDSETTWPISIKFHMPPPGTGGKKIYIFGSDHMIKIGAMPIYGKNLKNLPQNHWANFVETWYVSSETLELQSLHK